MNALGLKKSHTVWLALCLGLGLVWVAQGRAWAWAEVVGLKQGLRPGITKAMDGPITLHAIDQGHPWINLRDGRDLPTDYIGAAGPQKVLELGLAKPTALAAGDFDEDGVPDLVSGYVGPEGGLLVLHRGNVDAIYPNTSEAQARKAKGEFTDAPFLPPARVVAVAEAPDFLGAGDFDADGHMDIVTAAAGGRMLYWLAGNGWGNFAPAQRLALAGRVTALTTGEINRVDGLTDVAVGITGPEGPKLLVFESPDGALRGEPEAFALPAEATALVPGQLDEDYSMDLAVAVGQQLLIVHGRDRKLSLGKTRRAEVPPAVINQHDFPFTITAMAAGNFTGDPAVELALLAEDGTVHYLERAKGRDANTWKQVAARPLLSGRAQGVRGLGSNLISAKVSSLPYDDLVMIDRADRQLHILMNDFGLEPSAPNAKPATLVVEGEPAAALPMRLNADALSDLVVLKGNPNGLAVGLTTPDATFVVDSTGDQGDCDISDGICATGPMVKGQCTGPCTLRAAIQQANATPGADEIGFNISGPGPHTIITGGLVVSEAGGPVTIDGTTQPGYKGTPLIVLPGPGPATSSFALNIRSGSSTVRGLAINNFGNAINLSAPGGGNTIEGNFLGTDVTGTLEVRNGVGVFITGSPDNLIGGTTPAARNLMVNGNPFGFHSVRIQGTGNRVQGNFIGTDVTGTAALNGNAGIGIAASNNMVGGTEAGAGNLISGHLAFGVIVFGTGNLVQGNLIGTDVTGTVAMGNVRHGVNLLGNDHTFGGAEAGARNIISANGGHGIVYAIGQGRLLVQGNFIGTDITGTAALGNGGDGVLIGGSDNTIGGTASGAGNLISANAGNGVRITGASGNVRNLVQGNLIGTDIMGAPVLGNSLDGVWLDTVPGPTTIGGVTPGAGNVIAGNRGNGVRDGRGNNTIRGNSIFSNVGLGIDLLNAGVTDRNLPVLTSVFSSEAGTTVEGTLQSMPSTPNADFTLEFFSNTECDPSGYGEGESLLGSTVVRTDDSGRASFTVTFPIEVPAGRFITATATDPANITSEFSQCIAVTAAGGYSSKLRLPVRPPVVTPNHASAQSGRAADARTGLRRPHVQFLF